VEPVPGSRVWRMTGLAQGNLRDSRLVTVPAAAAPKGPALLALIQDSGPGAVAAVGITD